MTKLPQNLIQQQLSACKKVFYYLLFISFFSNILMLTVPIYMLQIYDRVLNSFSYETLIYLSIIAVIALIIYGFLDVLRARIIIKLGAWLDNNVSASALYQAIEQWLKGNNYGSNALRDMTQIRQFLSTPSTFNLFDVPWIPLYIMVIFLLHPVLGVISILGVILLFSVAVINERKTRKSLLAANTKAIENQLRIDLSIRNAEVISGMGMTNSFIDTWHKAHQDTLQSQTQTSQKASLYYSISKVLRLMLQIAMLGVGAFLVIKAELTPGGMIAGSILLARALAPVEASIGVWKQYVASRQSYQRLTLLFKHAIFRKIGVELPTPKGDIQIEKLSYLVPHHKEAILKSINIKIPAGRSLAILGPSGSGKTTLARMIIGALQPTQGNVRLDGADIYQWDRQHIGDFVGYLPQDIELFPGKINDNIARFEKYDDKDIIEAAKLAGVHEMILRFDKGYDTDLSDSQFVLSGGQRQRIALARALYKKPVLCVLDEPNSNLDAQGDAALIEVIRELKNRAATLIIITHKMSLIKEIDDVVLLQNGEIQAHDSVAKITEKTDKTRRKV